MIPDRLYRLPAVGERLELSTTQVRRLVSSGKLPCVRLGRKAVRVRESDLASFIASLTETSREAE